MAKQKIGDFLATLRKANGYTQQEVADRLGISNRTLSGWECNNVLPDILLLPALAELYGVTVDEILAGERKVQNEVALTNKSEKRILKNKIARFSTQCWILLGIIIAGMVLVSACSYIEVTKISLNEFPWWQVLLFIGIVPVVVCLAILFAFWKSAELTVDDTNESYGIYCIILRKKLANSLYVLSAAAAFATIIVASGVANSYRSKGSGSWVAFAIFAIALFVTAWLLYKRALLKFGGDDARRSIRNDRRYFWTVAFWGLIPFVLSVILAIVLGCVQFREVTTGVLRDYSTIGYAVAFSVIAADLIVCAVLCVLKRNKFAVKL